MRLVKQQGGGKVEKNSEKWRLGGSDRKKDFACSDSKEWGVKKNKNGKRRLPCKNMCCTNGNGAHRAAAIRKIIRQQNVSAKGIKGGST